MFNYAMRIERLLYLYMIFICVHKILLKNIQSSVIGVIMQYTLRVMNENTDQLI